MTYQTFRGHYKNKRIYCTDNAIDYRGGESIYFGDVSKVLHAITPLERYVIRIAHFKGVRKSFRDAAVARFSRT